MTNGLSILKVVYVLTIATFLIMLMGFGISAFYEEPKQPPFPPASTMPTPRTPEYDAWAKAQNEAEAKWQEQWQTYEQSRINHDRNVFIIAYPIGLIYVLLGLVLRPRLDIVKPALFLGALGTFVFALAQGDISNRIRFGGVAVVLAALIYVGYDMLAKRKPTTQV